MFGLKGWNYIQHNSRIWPNWDGEGKFKTDTQGHRNAGTGSTTFSDEKVETSHEVSMLIIYS